MRKYFNIIYFLSICITEDIENFMRYYLNKTYYIQFKARLQELNGKHEATTYKTAKISTTN